MYLRNELVHPYVSCAAIAVSTSQIHKNAPVENSNATTGCGSAQGVRIRSTKSQFPNQSPQNHEGDAGYAQCTLYCVLLTRRQSNPLSQWCSGNWLSAAFWIPADDESTGCCVKARPRTCIWEQSFPAVGEADGFGHQLSLDDADWPTALRTVRSRCGRRNEMEVSTLTCRWGFSWRLAGVPW